MNLTHVVKFKDIIVPPNRQRIERKPEHIVDLANSIAKNKLLHPPIVRSNETGQIILVAGESRLQSIDYLWNMGETLRCGEMTFQEGYLPVLFMGEMDPIDAFEAELEENIRRLDLDWKDRSAAISQLFELRCMQAEKKGEAPPTVASIAEEVRGTSEGKSQETTRRELILSRHLDDPDVQKAKSVDEGFKILKRKEELKRSAELGEQVGKTFTSAEHTLLKGDCLVEMLNLPDNSFDVILTDPPYGIDAQEFSNSGGKTPGAHFYDDSEDTWRAFISIVAINTFRLAKPQAHAYIFCDIDRFHELKLAMVSAGWKVFRTPLIWYNPTAMRAPWPEQGPQRKWQAILYAVKGDKQVTRLFSDVIVFPSDENLNHHAQKPVALYMDLLRRSVRPGDYVFDPFCGTGPIFPSAHELKCRATGIELDASAYGIAAKRLGALK